MSVGGVIVTGCPSGAGGVKLTGCPPGTGGGGGGDGCGGCPSPAMSLVPLAAIVSTVGEPQ